MVVGKSLVLRGERGEQRNTFCAAIEGEDDNTPHTLHHYS